MMLQTRKYAAISTLSILLVFCFQDCAEAPPGDGDQVADPTAELQYATTQADADAAAVRELVIKSLADGQLEDFVREIARETLRAASSDGRLLAAMETVLAPPKSPRGELPVDDTEAIVLDMVEFKTPERRGAANCDLGSEYNAATAACQPCSSGRFRGHMNQSTCEPCGWGTFADEAGLTNCSACPPGLTTDYKGANNVAECACAAGTYLSNASDSDASANWCVPCSEGLACAFGSREDSVGQAGSEGSPIILSGYMTLSKAPLKPYTCVDDAQRCMGERLPGNTSSMCEDGFDPDSRRCALCLEDYYVTPSTTCSPCSGVGMPLSGYVVLSLIAFACLAIFHSRTRKKQQLLCALFASLVQAIQMMMTVGNLQLMWPQILVNTAAGVYSVLTLSFLSFLLQWECIFGRSVLLVVLKDALLPLMLIPMFAIMYVIGIGIKKPITLKHVPNTVGLIFGGFFLSIATSACALFPVVEMPNDINMVIAYPSLVHGSDEWFMCLPFKIFSVLVYVVGFLSLLMYMTYQAPELYISNPQFRHSFQFALRYYRGSTYWWLSFELLFLLGITLVQSLSSNVFIQVYVSCLLLVANICIEFRAQPFIYPEANFVDLMMKLAIFCFAMISTAYIDTTGMSEEVLKNDRTMLAGLAIALICMAALAFVCSLGKELLEKTKPEGARLAKNILIASAFREATLLQAAIPDKDFFHRVHILSKTDLDILQKTKDALLAQVFHQQPADDALRRHLIPSWRYAVWDEKLEGSRLQAEQLSGEFYYKLASNARLRKAAVTLKADLKKQLKACGLKENFGLEDSAKYVMKQMRNFCSDDIEESEETMQQGANFLGIKGEEGIYFEDFWSKISPLTDLKNEDAKLIFDVADFHGANRITLDAFVAVVEGLVPEHLEQRRQLTKNTTREFDSIVEVERKISKDSGAQSEYSSDSSLPPTMRHSLAHRGRDEDCSISAHSDDSPPPTEFSESSREKPAEVADGSSQCSKSENKSVLSEADTREPTQKAGSCKSQDVASLSSAASFTSGVRPSMKVLHERNEAFDAEHYINATEAAAYSVSRRMEPMSPKVPLERDATRQMEPTALLKSEVQVGDTKLEVADHDQFAIGDTIRIGYDRSEENVVIGFGSLILKFPLRNAWPPGTAIWKESEDVVMNTMQKLGVAPPAAAFAVYPKLSAPACLSPRRAPIGLVNAWESGEVPSCGPPALSAAPSTPALRSGEETPATPRLSPMHSTSSMSIRLPERRDSFDHSTGVRVHRARCPSGSFDLSTAASSSESRPTVEFAPIASSAAHPVPNILGAMFGAPSSQDPSSQPVNSQRLPPQPYGLAQTLVSQASVSAPQPYGLAHDQTLFRQPYDRSGSGVSFGSMPSDVSFGSMAQNASMQLPVSSRGTAESYTPSLDGGLEPQHEAYAHDTNDCN